MATSLKNSIGKLTGVKIVEEPNALYKVDIGMLTPVVEEDKPISHLLNFWKGDFTLKKSPESDGLKLWSYGNFGIFYPVYEFKSDLNGKIIGVNSKLNSGAKVILGILFLFLIFNSGDVRVESLLSRLTFVVLGFMSIVLFVFYQIYKIEEEIALISICERLGFVFEVRKENNWSLKNISIRLFTYPFSVFLLFLAFWLIIPQQKFGLAVVIISLVVFYLITDIKNFKRNMRK